MHAAEPRNHRVLRVIPAIIGLLMGSATGCATAQPATPIGMSDAMPEAPHAATKLLPVREPWPDFVRAREWPQATPPFTATTHTQAASLLEIRVEPNSLSAYRSLAVDSPMPEGARVVAWRKTPDGQVLGGYALEKRDGKWSGRELAADGAVMSTNPAQCLRCHEMAPADYLFGVPRLRVPVEANLEPREGTEPPAR